MARKLRLEYPGAICHVMNRGDRREAIFLTDSDRLNFNRRHNLCGHLFSARYKSLCVDGSGNGYLKSVCDLSWVSSRENPEGIRDTILVSAAIRGSLTLPNR